MKTRIVALFGFGLGSIIALVKQKFPFIIFERDFSGFPIKLGVQCDIVGMMVYGLLTGSITGGIHYIWSKKLNNDSYRAYSN